MKRTYSTAESQTIRMNSAMWGFVQKFAEQFFEGKQQTPECEYSLTEEQAKAACLAIDAIADGMTVAEIEAALSAASDANQTAANKAWLDRGLAALNDPACAAEAEMFCDRVRTKLEIV